MKSMTRAVAIAACVVALGSGTVYASAEPTPKPKPGTSCGEKGENKVITSINTCAKINSSCTGYDMMIIGRVDKFGHCVIPGINGTTW